MSAAAPNPAIPPVPPAGAPAPLPPAATPPASAPAADEPPAWFKAFQSSIDARFATVEGVKAKAEADKNAAEAKALTADEKHAALSKQLEKLEASARADKVDGAIGRVSAGLSFATPAHGDAGLRDFRTTHKFDVAPDGSVLATGPGGKPLHLADALSAWAKGPGSIFVTANAQPGAALGSPLNGAAPPAKRVKDMTDAEFDAQYEGEGFRGKLTGAAREPEFVMRAKHNPYAALRAERLAAIPGFGKPKA